MAIEILVLDSDHEYYENEFTLDDESFRIQARYNARIDSWMLSLFDGDGNAIAVGRRVTVGNFLFPWLTGRNRPGGQLMAIDSEDRSDTGGTDPGRYDLGERVVILYLDAAEMEAAGANGG